MARGALLRQRVYVEIKSREKICKCLFQYAVWKRKLKFVLTATVAIQRFYRGFQTRCRADVEAVVHTVKIRHRMYAGRLSSTAPHATSFS